ncbi:alpha-amylase [Chroococcus sp. FPU101]|uniref:alpha-amylase n=1 Tax=Chroococcus sp. FPU101 TaxID=1974212 RepID=UPI001A8E5A13|nr:alpha-amylase [Chroococcus sp. FPU101]GFE70855.1 alpha-amylase [Chroococcus sp. FPU101]
MAEVNGVMMQYFHWYIPDDGSLWNEANKNAKELADAGITALWLPPAYKGIGGKSDVGYGVYDYYDLGEFDQKNSVRTKYGTKEEYIAAIKSLQSHGIQVYADAVLNHKMGADSAEVVKATPYPIDDRINPKGGLQEIKTYTHFHFPNRQKKYSDFEWHWYHFDGVDYNEYNKDDRSTVYLLENKSFDDYVALEKGNFAYLMGCDIDFQSKEVQDELLRWGKWYLDTTGVDGFRLDALKHISASFFPKWLKSLEEYVGKKLFVVGEYWSPNVNDLDWYIDWTGGMMSVFAVALHYNFHYASKGNGNYDMRRILEGTILQYRSQNAVSFVANHDSQALQALESVVEPWFTPLAYAIILLRREGYPCIFYPDYYGAEYEDYGRDGQKYKIIMPSHRWLIDKFLYVRKHYAHGEQYDYFDHPDRVGWTRLGNQQNPKAMAVLLSDQLGGTKWMEVGKPNAKFIDYTEHVKEPVYTNEWGWGEFKCNGGSVSVWIES